MDALSMVPTADTLRLNTLLNEHRDSIVRILRAQLVTSAFLFGSVARGSAGPSSDIDVYVTFGPLRDSTIFMKVAGLTDWLTEELGAKVDVLTDLLADPAILETARKDMVPLWDGK